MKFNRPLGITGLLIMITLGVTGFIFYTTTGNDDIISYTADPQKQHIQFYWKNDSGDILGSFRNLQAYTQQKNTTLLFAMNGGMYDKAQAPIGLYIEDKKKLHALNTNSGSGNFYLEPNGVFYLTTDHIPVVCKTADFADKGNIAYATQSGPMLLIDGQIHPAFRQGSSNLNIRNGVGILPDNKVLFAISKKEINFYDFATYFKNMGCKNALYLDGFVSRIYWPEKDIQQDGDFGVMIGVTKNVRSE